MAAGFPEIWSMWPLLIRTQNTRVPFPQNLEFKLEISLEEIKRKAVSLPTPAKTQKQKSSRMIKGQSHSAPRAKGKIRD